MINANAQTKAGNMGLQRALGKSQRSGRVIQHSHRSTAIASQYQARAFRHIRQQQRQHGIQLRAQARLLCHRAARKIVYPQQHYAALNRQMFNFGHIGENWRVKVRNYFSARILDAYDGE
jgi:hypothetical protein